MGEYICKIYACPIVGGKRVCCADCLRKNCPNRCLNAPDRCGVSSVNVSTRKTQVRKKIIDRDEVRALYYEGLSNNQIAQQVGCSASTISKIMASLGLRRYKSEVADCE